MSDKPAPYPADTKAKGWRFELDLEQIAQSDTWALAAEIPMAQHTLLMMWAVAWQQTPCGAMPADHALLRAKLRVPPKLWTPMADVVVRGWWLAADGRLYHDTITSRVLDMLGRKDSERLRKAEYRARMDSDRKTKASANVPRDNQRTDEGRDKDGHGKDDTGTGTGTGTSNTPPPPQREHGSIEVFPITTDWRPSGQFAILAKLAGLLVGNQPAIDAGLGEFKAYWLTQPHVVRTQLEWDNALVKSLKHEQVKAASTAGQRTGKPSRHTGFDAKDYSKGVTADGSLM